MQNLNLLHHYKSGPNRDHVEGHHVIRILSCWIYSLLALCQILCEHWLCWDGCRLLCRWQYRSTEGLNDFCGHSINEFGRAKERWVCGTFTISLPWFCASVDTHKKKTSIFLLLFIIPQRPHLASLAACIWWCIESCQRTLRLILTVSINLGELETLHWLQNKKAAGGQCLIYPKEEKWPMTLSRVIPTLPADLQHLEMTAQSLGMLIPGSVATSGCY